MLVYMKPKLQLEWLNWNAEQVSKFWRQKNRTFWEGPENNEYIIYYNFNENLKLITFGQAREFIDTCAT
jgi:hypothetical protein